MRRASPGVVPLPVPNKSGDPPPIDRLCQIGILVSVFVAEQHQIVQGIAPQDIAETIAGRKLGYPGERVGTTVQFVGFAGMERSIIRPAKRPARDLGSEVAKRSSDVEWRGGLLQWGSCESPRSAAIADARSFSRRAYSSA
jgi:hypothetical protein